MCAAKTGSMSIRDDHDRNVTVFEASGPVTPEDVSLAVEERFSNGPRPNAIWDLTDADVSKWTNDGLRHVAAVSRKFVAGRENGLSIIVVSDIAKQMFIKLYTAISEGELNSPITYVVLDTIDEAYAALDQKS